ncbi:MAG: hypothetical protein AB8H86_09760 [Polyangiales bacterium]
MSSGVTRGAAKGVLYICEDLDNTAPMRLGGFCLVLILGCTVEHAGLLPADRLEPEIDASALV